jgi:hypothetical protein
MRQLIWTGEKPIPAVAAPDRPGGTTTRFRSGWAEVSYLFEASVKWKTRSRCVAVDAGTDLQRE